MSIPLHMVSGFLGSGKTSFVKHFLKNLKGEGKPAIIQNEFSQVDIDGREIQQEFNYKVLEINNGSAFCVCLLGSFIQSLALFVEEVKPDLLIMETSGLSDPSAVSQMFQAKALKGKVFLEHSWCLVDALNYKRLSAMQVRMERQLRSADTIIINKTDIANDEATLIANQVEVTNPFARILKANHGKIIFSKYAAPLKVFPVENLTPMGRPDLESFVIRGNKKIGRNSFNEFFQTVKDDCIRCKGFIKLKEGGAAFVQTVFDEISIQEINDFTGSIELVLIGLFSKDKNLQIIYDEYCNRNS